MKNIPGYFDNENREYVITNMHPVRTLKNYLWNEKVVSFYDQFGFGVCKANTNVQLRPITIEERLVFIKDNQSQEFYSPNRNYHNLPFETYECHVGLGYHKIISKYQGIKVEMTILIPVDDYAEIIHVKISNESNIERDLSIYTYLKPHVNLTWHTAYSYADYNKKMDGLYFTHVGFNIDEKYNRVLVRPSEKPTSYDVYDVKFKGIYNELSNPIGLINEELSSSACTFEDYFSAAMQFKVLLKPNEVKEINLVTVIAKNDEEALDISSKYYKNESFYTELEKQINHNDIYTNRYLVNTPDEHINQLINYWLKRQVTLGKTWGRVYGKGFRDVLQDTSSFVALDPHFAVDRIKNTLKYQFENGNSIRMFDPIMDEPYQDGAAWIPATVLSYLKETNDPSILDEEVEYYNSQVKESIYKHMKRGIDYLLSIRGEHNLILWGGGDWNDSLNNCGRKWIGESVWLSIATVKAINDFEKICKQYRPDESILEEYIKQREVLKCAIMEYGFEYDRFIYGYNDAREKIGSNDSPEGKIYLNPQTWAVLAEVVKGEEAVKLMDSVEKYLKCDYGYVQVVPAYSVGTDNIGRASYFKPGNFENGSVYNHGVSFKIAADLKLKLNDRAYKTLKLISYDNPLNPNSGMEPYAFSNMFLGPECECRRGFAPSAWITGTAGWIYNDITEHMIGIKPNFDSLIIDPCIPSHWDKVKAFRIYQNCKYEITIIKCEKNELWLDGKLLDSNIIPVINDDIVHKVVCFIK